MLPATTQEAALQAAMPQAAMQVAQAALQAVLQAATEAATEEVALQAAMLLAATQGAALQAVTEVATVLQAVTKEAARLDVSAARQMGAALLALEVARQAKQATAVVLRVSAALLVALQAGQLPSPARGRVRGEDEAMLPDPMPQAKPLRAAAAARRAAAWKTQQLGGVHQPMTSLRQMEAVLPAEEARQATVEEATLPAAAAVWQVEAAPPAEEVDARTPHRWHRCARRDTHSGCTVAPRLILQLKMVVAAARSAGALPAAAWQARAEARQPTTEAVSLPAAAAPQQEAGALPTLEETRQVAEEVALPPTTRRQWFHLARRGTRKWCTAASRLILRLQMVAAARWARVLPAAVWQARAQARQATTEAVALPALGEAQQGTTEVAALPTAAAVWQAEAALPALRATRQATTEAVAVAVAAMLRKAKAAMLAGKAHTSAALLAAAWRVEAVRVQVSTLQVGALRTLQARVLLTRSVSRVVMSPPPARQSLAMLQCATLQVALAGAAVAAAAADAVAVADCDRPRALSRPPPMAA